MFPNSVSFPKSLDWTFGALMDWRICESMISWVSCHNPCHSHISFPRACSLTTEEDTKNNGSAQMGRITTFSNIKLAEKMAGSSGFSCSGTSTLQSLPEGEQEIELEESEKDHRSGKLHRSDPVEMILWSWDQVCKLYQETLVPVVSCFFPCWYSCCGWPHQSQHQGVCGRK